MIKRQIVVVHWEDSEGTGSWTGRKTVQESFDRPMPDIVTCGFLWESKKTHIGVYQSHDTSNDCFDHILRIPRSAIKSVERLGPS